MMMAVSRYHSTHNEAAGIIHPCGRCCLCTKLCCAHACSSLCLQVSSLNSLGLICFSVRFLRWHAWGGTQSEAHALETSYCTRRARMSFCGCRKSLSPGSVVSLIRMLLRASTSSSWKPTILGVPSSVAAHSLGRLNKADFECHPQLISFESLTMCEASSCKLTSHRQLQLVKHAGTSRSSLPAIQGQETSVGGQLHFRSCCCIAAAR